MIISGTENYLRLLSVSSSFQIVFQTVHHNAYYEDPYAQEFGIKIDERLASVEARVLPAPWVSFLGFWLYDYDVFTTIIFDGLVIIALGSPCIFSLNTTILEKRRIACPGLASGI